MTERLRPRDLALLAIESPRTPMHNATVEIFECDDSGFDYAQLIQLIEERIAFVPRYRQRIAAVPGRLATPVWVDYPDFEVSYHVRRSALPRPGDLGQLRELVARIASRPLDRSRPLWEIYLVEGLEHGRFAVLTKSHQLLVDGKDTVDIGHVLMDEVPDRPRLGGDDWHPQGRPDALSLAVGAVRDSLASPSTIAHTVQANAQSLLRTTSAAGHRFGEVAGALVGRRPASSSPVHRKLSQQRRFLAVGTQLKDYRKVRDVHGGTVNDVILATIAGGLRAWLMSRTESMGGLKSLSALVPMSVLDDELDPTQLGTQVTGHLVELPIAEPSPVVRLHQVSYSFEAHKATGRAVGAARLADISGFAPTTFHALGSRVAAAELGRGFDVAVTNVPGPQFPLYLGGARMVETYPVHPLLPDHTLSIGVTSYDGGVFYGITADRDALPDVDTLGQCLVEALEELKDSASESRPRAPRGRKKSSK